MRLRAIRAVCLVLPGIVAGHASAQAPPPAQRAQVYSPYEQQTIDEVLGELGATRDLDPEGKLIEHIDIVPLGVFEPRDPLPQWLNALHVTTKRSVVAREMLLREGDRYRQVLSDDTIRNLRRLPQISVVLVIASAGTARDRVRVVVITKDVWSLRLNWNIVATSAGLEELELQPAEWNVLGTHQTASGHFVFEPLAYTFGLGYQVPRIEGTRVALVAGANLVTNRATGLVEGSYGSLVAGQPIYSGLTDWAWDATVAWQDYVARRYVNAKLYEIVDPVTGRTIPFEYRERGYQANLELTRSFGWDTKHDFTFAAAIDRSRYLTEYTGADPRTVAGFLRVPVDDTRVGPSIQYHLYAKRYLRVIDAETLALQEDFALGPNLVLRAYPSLRLLGGSRDVLGLYAAAQYTVALRDGLLRALFVSVTEPEAERIADASISPSVRLVTPTALGVGRVVLDATLLYRWRNYLNQTTFLGGDRQVFSAPFLAPGHSLRGYPTNFFVGQDFVAYSLEVRSRPVEILSCQVAGVAFFDAGDAFYELSSLRPFQSVGAGMRALFPWLDRSVFRVDVGVPIERPIDPATRTPAAPLGTRIAPLAFLVSFGQGFDVPNVNPSAVLPTGQ